MKNLKDYMSIKEAAEFLGVCQMTLRRWDKSGKLRAYRNPMSNYRLYRRNQLKTLLRKISRKKMHVMKDSY